MPVNVGAKVSGRIFLTFQGTRLKSPVLQKVKSNSKWKKKKNETNYTLDSLRFLYQGFSLHVDIRSHLQIVFYNLKLEIVRMHIHYTKWMNRYLSTHTHYAVMRIIYNNYFNIYDSQILIIFKMEIEETFTKHDTKHCFS